MSGIQAKQIAGYVIMPGIIPRIKGFFTSGFGYIAFLIAQIYGMVKLLPPTHPYLNPNNIGKYGLRNVIAQAANHLVFKKENIDQIIIFAAILIGLALLIIQFAMIIIAFLFEPAMAAFPSAAFPIGSSIFVTNAPTLDIAYMLLDQVFGIPGFFGSCIEQSVSCGGNVASTPVAFPWPFHTALQDLFRFYNTGILVIGALIFLYFVLIVVGETAVTGTPFGQRFQNVWAPIRLVVALGLLIPLGFGFNSSQYITLFAAKVGSSFATNGWITYNNTIAGNGFYTGGAGANPTGERESLIGNPKAPDATPIVEAMSLIHTCAMSMWYIETASPKPQAPPNTGFKIVEPYFIKEVQNWMVDQNPHLLLTASTTYAQALAFYNNSDIIIRFGENGDTNNDGTFAPTPGIPGGDNADAENETANVIPHCGEIRININQTGGTGTLIGAEAVQEMYFNLIRDMWFTPSNDMKAFAWRYASLTLARNDALLGPNSNCAPPPSSGIPTTGTGIVSGTRDNCKLKPTIDWRSTQINNENTALQTALTTIWTNYAAATNMYEMTAQILSRGWAGAGIWYNTISRVNGNYMSSTRNIPEMVKQPRVFTQVQQAQNRENTEISNKDRFCPNLSELGLGSDQESVATVLCQVYQYWNETPNTNENEVTITGSVFEDTMNLIFGTQPLSSMAKENTKTHPLAQLALLGKGLVDASIRNIATASIGSAMGGLATAIDKVMPALVGPAMSFVSSTAFVGLTAGLVLYYIVPFLPFIYFFFAVASWLKSIFEAMVGAPLWALAHLRLDGEGLPGTSAANGYFLIFEIFIRPILTIFGLIAATLIFTAQVRVLHFLWQMVTENLSGYDNDPTIAITNVGRLAFKRSIVDQFFFQVIYAIIVYMMAIAAFKLIDKIPDNLLRWMGNSVSSFSDINQDSVDGLTRYAALGGATAGQRLAGGTQQLASQAGGSVGTLLAKLGGGST